MFTVPVPLSRHRLVESVLCAVQLPRPASSRRQRGREWPVSFHGPFSVGRITAQHYLLKLSICCLTDSLIKSADVLSRQKAALIPLSLLCVGCDSRWWKFPSIQFSLSFFTLSLCFCVCLCPCVSVCLCVLPCFFLLKVYLNWEALHAGMPKVLCLECSPETTLSPLRLDEDEQLKPHHTAAYWSCPAPPIKRGVPL